MEATVIDFILSTLMGLSAQYPDAAWLVTALSVVMTVCGLCAVATAHSLNLLTGLVCLYFPQLLCNAAESLRIRTDRAGRRFSLGLCLFLCCDICVGLHNLFLAAPPALPGLARTVQLAMWAFYLPSQVLIVLSADGRPDG